MQMCIDSELLNVSLITSSVKLAMHQQNFVWKFVWKYRKKMFIDPTHFIWKPWNFLFDYHANVLNSTFRFRVRIVINIFFLKQKTHSQFPPLQKKMSPLTHYLLENVTKVSEQFFFSPWNSTTHRYNRFKKHYRHTPGM